MARNILLLLLLLIVSISCLWQVCSASKARHFKWEVGYVFWSPDCVENVMIGINGRFPGPTIRAKAGDTIVVELKNGLPTEGVVIHWHGIRQFGTPWADGTASISQCAINPEETFVYRFRVDKPGTYFYHGHYGMQRAAGLYGSLIVDPPEGEKEPFHYDEEINLLLSDWYHQNIYAQMVGLSSKPFRWIGEPQSLLINGRGQYNCSLVAIGGASTCNINSTQCMPVVFPVLPNKTYRVRIASITSLASLNLAIGGRMGSFYVVFVGRRPGIYSSWPECNAQVSGYRNNVHQRYNTYEEAEEAFMKYWGFSIPNESTSTSSGSAMTSSNEFHSIPRDRRGQGEAYIRLDIVLLLIIVVLLLFICLILSLKV